MIDFLFLLPLWVLAVLLNIWLMGFSLACLWAVRRWVSPRLNLNTNAALFYGAAVTQSGMVFYGLVAALTAVSVWTKHSQVTDVVSSEATAIAVLWRNLDGYPQPARNAMHEVLRSYTKQIIHEDWPEQKQARIPHPDVDWMDRFQVQLFSYEPVSEAQKSLHAKTLDAYSRMIEARQLRLDAVNGRLPGVMWWVLLPGAMGCVLLACFFPVEDARFQALLVMGLSGFVAMVLFVIISLDRPLHGAMAIAPQSYELIYDQLMKR